MRQDADTKPVFLDGGDVRRLLSEIGAEFARRGQTAEIALYGGSALVLMFDHRKSTHDIDFLPVACDTGEVVEVAEAVGQRNGLPEGWFNDAVQCFASPNPDYRFFGDFPPERPGLRVFVAAPEYILAMKMLEMRGALESSDVSDIWHLADACGVADLDTARKWVGRFFPGDNLAPHREARLADLFAAKQAGRPYNPMDYW